MRPSKDTYFFDMARTAATRSTCLRRRHGSVVVKNGHILATGYNGSASGLPNCTDGTQCPRELMGVEPGTRYELCQAVHSEVNALLQAARYGAAVEGATLYVTGLPCLMCARAIINAGIAEVKYLSCERYKDAGIVATLEKAGVRVKGV